MNPGATESDFYWRDLWRTLHAMLCVVWTGWKVFIAEPEEIAVESKIATREQLEALQNSSIFSERVGQVYLNQMLLLANRFIEGFEADYEVLLSELGNPSLEFKAKELTSQERGFAELGVAWSILSDEWGTRFIQDDLIKTLGAANKGIKGERDKKGFQLRVDNSLRESRRLPIAEAIFKELLPITALTSPHKPS